MALEGVTYTPFYCEENIWLLSKHPTLAQRSTWAAFISNPTRTCALWSQKAADSPETPVIWDYHVVLIAESRTGGFEIWDLDTLAGCPLPVEIYLQATFPLAERIIEAFRPMFRIVEADVLRKTFASDRSHMRDSQSGWLHPPPPYPPLSCPGQTMNLQDFVSMTADFVGTVVDFEGFQREFCLKS